MTAYAIYRMRQARESLDQEGLLIQQGEKLVKNPAANIEKDYQKILANPENSIVTGNADAQTVSASVGYTPEELERPLIGVVCS